MPDSPDPVALLRRLEALQADYHGRAGIDQRLIEEAAAKMLPDLIPVVRRAVELEGENARLVKENGFTERIMEAIRKHANGDEKALAGMGVPWVDELIAARDNALSEKDRCIREMMVGTAKDYLGVCNQLTAHRESAASALKLLGITPGPDPVAELCGVVPGMVVKLREALREAGRPKMNGESYERCWCRCLSERCMDEPRCRDARAVLAREAGNG